MNSHSLVSVGSSRRFLYGGPGFSHTFYEPLRTLEMCVSWFSVRCWFYFLEFVFRSLNSRQIPEEKYEIKNNRFGKASVWAQITRMHNSSTYLYKTERKCEISVRNIRVFNSCLVITQVRDRISFGRYKWHGIDPTQYTRPIRARMFLQTYLEVHVQAPFSKLCKHNMIFPTATPDCFRKKWKPVVGRAT